MDNVKISINTDGTHLDELCSLAEEANRMVICSPFLANNIGKLLDGMKSIKTVDVYTNLDGFENGVATVESLTSFAYYCEKYNIELNMYYEDSLHGKVYLFYEGDEPKGFIVTSANFTNNGLEKNVEYGFVVHNAELQEEMFEHIREDIRHTLSAAHLAYIYSKAQEYKEKYQQKKEAPFKASKYVKSEVSATTRYFMKNIGRSDSWHPKTPMVEDFELGFSTPNCQKGDILIISAIGHSLIMGMYMVLDDIPHTFVEGPEDKWPHKYKLRCMTKEFSEKWWKYRLSTMPLENDFIENRLSPKDHIRDNSDSLQIIKWGKPFRVNKEFADFVLKRMNEKVEKDVKWTELGTVNKNNQRNNGKTDEPGTDNGQWFYEMECLNCGHKYKANGSDIWQRKCPNCQGGRA